MKAFTLRIRFFAGEATIYAQHTFVYEGEPYTDFIGGIGLTLPLGLHPDKKRRVTTVGGETRREAWIYANPLFGYDPPEIPNPGGDYPFWKQGGLLQDTDGSYLIWKCWDRKHARLVMDRGQKAPGWIHISDQETGAAIVMPDMWKIYPKELYASNEEGYLTAYFYPESLPPLDLRRYAPIFGTGESESYGPGQATGVSRTHEIFIFFNEGSPLDKAVMDDIEAKAVGLSGKTVLFVDPEWYVSTNVVGEFAVADTGKFPVLDKLIADSTNFMLVHRNTYRWFGFFDYGDFQSIYRYFAPVENEVHLAKNYPNLTDNLRWMNDWGRWGWVNDEGLITFWLFIQFFRTGDYAVFEAANACACHVRDVDTAHTKEYYNIPDGCMEDVRGKGKRHNVQHWGDGYFGTRVSIPIAQRLQYYMTGDGRTRDVMDEVYECSVNRMEPDWVSDSIATSLYSIFARWEMTGEEKYGKMLDSYIKACLEYQQKNNGVFPYNATFDFEKGKVISFKGNHHSMFWHAFGMTNFLLEYYFLTKDPDLAKGLIRLAETTLEFDKTARAERWFRYYLYNQIYAAGYMLTKREDFKEQILKNIKLNLGDRRFVPKNPEHWIGEKAKVGPKTISMIGFAMAGLPYAMAAIGDEGPDMVD